MLNIFLKFFAQGKTANFPVLVALQFREFPAFQKLAFPKKDQRLTRARHFFEKE